VAGITFKSQCNIRHLMTEEVIFMLPYPSFGGAQYFRFERFICRQNPPSP